MPCTNQTHNIYIFLHIYISETYIYVTVYKIRLIYLILIYLPVLCRARFSRNKKNYNAEYMVLVNFNGSREVSKNAGCVTRSGSYTLVYDEPFARGRMFASSFDAEMSDQR